MDRRPVKLRRVGSTAVVDDAVRETGEDLISSFPDEILLSIFHCIPVGEWPSLSAVSRQWHRLTRLLPRLDYFYLRNPPSAYYDCRTMSYSSRVPPPVPRAFIRRFRIDDYSFYGEPEGVLESFVELAKSAAVEELLIENDGAGAGAGVPNLVFDIKTLRGLLVKNYTLHDPSHRLSSSMLRSVTVESCNIRRGAMNGILDGCRHLETLNLIDCEGFIDPKIHSERLKNLRLLRNRPRRRGYRISIHAPNLEVLVVNIEQNRLSVLDIQAPKVQELCLDLSHEPAVVQGKEFVRFFVAAKELTSLSINHVVVWVLAKLCKKLDVYFEKMKLLAISLDTRHEPQLVFLIKFLRKCPRPVHLNLQVVPICGHSSSSEVLPDLRVMECFGHLQSMRMDLLIDTCYDGELLRVIFAKATKLRTLDLTLPWFYEQDTAARIMLSLKALSLNARRKKYSLIGSRINYAETPSRIEIKMEF